MIACSQGHEEIMNFLIKANAKVNNTDGNGNTCLHYASMKGHDRIVKILMGLKSIDANIKNKSGRAAADTATKDEIRKIISEALREKKIKEDKTSTIPIFTFTFDNLKRMFMSESSNKSKEPTNSVGQGPDPNVQNPPIAVVPKLPTKVGPDNFEVKSLLGKGSFSEVYLVRDRQTDTMYAMKVLSKQKIFKQNLIKYAMSERNILSIVQHPFIVKLNYAFQTGDKLFLILVKIKYFGSN
jgi:hypothetical protein